MRGDAERWHKSGAAPIDCHCCHKACFVCNRFFSLSHSVCAARQCAGVAEIWQRANARNALHETSRNRRAVCGTQIFCSSATVDHIKASPRVLRRRSTLVSITVAGAPGCKHLATSAPAAWHASRARHCNIAAVLCCAITQCLGDGPLGKAHSHGAFPPAAPWRQTVSSSQQSRCAACR